LQTFSANLARKSTVFSSFPEVAGDFRNGQELALRACGVPRPLSDGKTHLYLKVGPDWAPLRTFGSARQS
jgi:hypothetical protein